MPLFVASESLALAVMPTAVPTAAFSATEPPAAPSASMGVDTSASSTSRSRKFTTVDCHCPASSSTLSAPPTVPSNGMPAAMPSATSCS